MPAPLRTQMLVTSKCCVGNRRAIKNLIPKVPATPRITPAAAIVAVSRRITSTMVSFEAPIDLRMPISRVRSSTAVYID
jgi:hypothetical protein